MLKLRLRDRYPASLLRMVEEDLSRLQDPLQEVIDRNRLADSRHVLAVRREER